MTGDRLLRILARFDADGFGSLGPSERLCALCVEVVGLTGAAVVLRSDDLTQGVLCSSDDVSALVEDLQFTLGEGPSVDAFREDRPVSEWDLAHPTLRRWLSFTPPAVKGGVRALFAFPIRVGSARLGTLSLYRDQPGPMGDSQHADSLLLAGVVGRAVLDMQAKAPAGELGVDLESGVNFRVELHQAAGMVSVQLEVSIAEALIRLRAHAFTHDRSLSEVAAAVVARQLHLE